MSPNSDTWRWKTGCDRLGVDTAGLALLSDCNSSALIGRDASLEWWPGGRFDGPSAFSRLLDDDAGHFSTQVRDAHLVSRGYRTGTFVLVSEYRTERGARAVITDCLALQPGAKGHEIGMRSPGAFVRSIEAFDADIEIDVEFIPRLEYGLAVPRVVREGGVIATEGGPERIFLTGGEDLEIGESSARGRSRIRAGERRGFVLHRRDGIRARPPLPLDAGAVIEATTESWRSWAELHSGYEGPYRDEVLRSALVVQALTHQPTGTVVAAATTSLPEVIGGTANWDYRFGWLRDASLIARSLMGVTCADEAHRYFDWILKAAITCHAGSHVQIVFGVDGERRLDEQALSHLRGFRDSRPVRVGNAAWRQTQLDVYGEILDVACSLGDALELDDVSASFLCLLVDRALSSWREADAGIWERRDGEFHHLVSKVMCWTALDRGVRLADRLGDGADPERWAAERDVIRTELLHEGFNESRGAFTGELGGDILDSAVLLLPLVGFLDAGDERMLSTMTALQRHLSRDGLLRRREDMDESGAFLPCCFWLANCQARAGQPEAARRTFERAARSANEVGLLAEMTDPDTGAPLGNLPLALSHVALISAAQAIEDAER